MGAHNNNLTNQRESSIIGFNVLLMIFIAMAFLSISSPPVAVGTSNIVGSAINTRSIPVAYAQPSEDNNAITAGLGEPFQLRINQTAIIMPDNMSITLLDVPEDSRCPAFVVCVWPGQVTVSINVTETFPSFPRLLNLTLGPLPSNSSANVDSHIIELLQVEPHPMRDEQIPKGDYTATLIALPPRPIPTGEWDIMSNGLHGTLNITSIDMEGHLSGTILLYPFDTPPNDITGYVDGDSGKVTFVRTIGPSSTDIEVYTGYIFTNIIADCLIGTGPGSCYDHASMAGTFESFYETDDNNNSTLIGTFGDAKRNMFGWFASHVPQPCPACPS